MAQSTDKSLQSFIETASSHSPFRVEDDFGSGFVRLRSEEAQRRQAAHDIRSSEDIVIEALRNARDAEATHIFVASGKEGTKRHIVVIDDGCGVPPFMHERIFEPRVTSKLDTVHMDRWGVHGRGMALYSIAVNCEAAFVASSDTGLGSAFFFSSDTEKLGEKADQSSFPRFELSNSDNVLVRGPKNIIRTACEFAVDSAPQVLVFLGSMVDIAATLYAFSLASTSKALRTFCKDPQELPLVKRLGTAADPASFSSIAKDMGLELSERSCRRIMDGSISPLEPLSEQISIKDPRHLESKTSSPTSLRSQNRKIKALKDQRGLHIAKEDLELFEDALQRAYSQLAQAYYLDSQISPEIRVQKNRILVSFPVEKLS